MEIIVCVFLLDYASLCSLGDWFETRFVGSPEDRLSRDKAHLIYI